MTVNVLSLLLGNEKSIDVDFEENINSPRLKDDRFKVISPVKVDGKLTIVEDTVCFKGTLSATCNFVCDRCLNDFVADIEADIYEEFKAGVSKDDEDYMPIVNEKIDLTDSIIKNILINIPVKLLCSEDCTGIEFDRPKDDDEKEDSPFSVLKDLKI